MGAPSPKPCKNIKAPFFVVDAALLADDDDGDVVVVVDIWMALVVKRRTASVECCCVGCCVGSCQTATSSAVDAARVATIDERWWTFDDDNNTNRCIQINTHTMCRTVNSSCVYYKYICINYV